jgi:hypothetical protein
MALINGVEISEKSLIELAKAGVTLNIGQKNDPSGSTPTASTLHGANYGNGSQYGLFSAPGVRPDRFSALSRPRSMTSLLRPQKSDLINEIVEIVTGQTAGTTTNATGWCADGANVSNGQFQDAYPHRALARSRTAQESRGHSWPHRQQPASE